jgi:hypothetical protein
MGSGKGASYKVKKGHSTGSPGLPALEARWFGGGGLAPGKLVALSMPTAEPPPPPPPLRTARYFLLPVLAWEQAIAPPAHTPAPSTHIEYAGSWSWSDRGNLIHASNLCESHEVSIGSGKNCDFRSLAK